MDCETQYLQDGLEGITPHSCELCTRIVIDPYKCGGETNEDYPYEFTFQQVAEAACQGCPLFGRRLEWACRLVPSAAARATSLSTLQITPKLIGDDCYLQFQWKGNNPDVEEESDDLKTFSLNGTTQSLDTLIYGELILFRELRREVYQYATSEARPMVI